MARQMTRAWTDQEVSFLKGLRDLGILAAYNRVARGEGTPEALQDLGHRIWNITYKFGQKDDTEEGATVGKSVQKIVYTILAAIIGIDPDTAEESLPPSEVIQTAFATHWVDQACPQIVVGHKYAAALMSTKIGKDTMDQVRPPWRAFTIAVPNGLLHIWNERADCYAEINHIAVFHRYNDYRKRYEWAYHTLSRGTGLSLWRFGVDTEQLLVEKVNDNPYREHALCDELTSADQRTSLLIGRLIVNTCIAMTDRKQVKKVGRSHTSGVRPGDRKPPPVRVFQVGRKIAINCIDAVKDYALKGPKRGKSGPATVQTLVCGHHKLQPYGPKNPDGTWGPQRKLIWREPFWRGPEDAPIVTRPHEFKTGDSQEKEC